MFNQAASTRCSVDNKEKLSTNILSEYASDFCHDRKSEKITAKSMYFFPFHMFTFHSLVQLLLPTVK